MEEATRLAHRWVADVLHGALGNGSADDSLEDPAVAAAVTEIVNLHDVLGHTTTRPNPDEDDEPFDPDQLIGPDDILPSAVREERP